MYEATRINEVLEQIDTKLTRIEKFVRAKEKPFLSIAEAAQYTGIPKATLYGFTSAGKIPYHKLNGRRVYFSIEELNRFILSKKNRHKSIAEIESEAETKIIIGRR